MNWPAYIRISRYADRPVALAEATVYLPPAYVPRVCLVDACTLLEIYRALRQAGPVKVYFHQTGPAKQESRHEQ